MVRRYTRRRRIFRRRPRRFRRRYRRRRPVRRRRARRSLVARRRFGRVRTPASMYPQKLIMRFKRTDKHSGSTDSFAQLIFDPCDIFDFNTGSANNQEAAFFRRWSQNYTYCRVVAWTCTIKFVSYPTQFYQENITGVPPEGAPNSMLGHYDLGTVVLQGDTSTTVTQQECLNGPLFRNKFHCEGGKSHVLRMSWRTPRAGAKQWDPSKWVGITATSGAVATDPPVISNNDTRPMGIFYHVPSLNSATSAKDTSYAYYVFQTKTVEFWDKRVYDLANAGN